VLELARLADPALDPADIAAAGRYLDRLDDGRSRSTAPTPHPSGSA
jgi:hypothetical protein